MFSRRYARPLSHYAPLPMRRAYKALTALFGRDDFSYVSLAPGEPARLAAEAPLPALDPDPRPVDPGALARVCLHLHYPELWPEFETLLKAHMPEATPAEPAPWSLCVTLTPNAADVAGEVSAAFPGSRVEIVENRGRDIGPFFHLLRTGALDGARAVCKLHGKRSLSDKRPQLLGEVWRRSAVLSLIGRSADVMASLAADGTDLVAAGPAHLLAPSARIPEKSAWAGRRREVEAWAARLGIAEPEIRFFAGSMLWLGRSVLDALRMLDLSLEDFEAEANLGMHGPTYTGERILLIPAQNLPGRVALLGPTGEIVSTLD